MDERFLNLTSDGALAPPPTFWLACVLLLRYSILVLGACVAARHTASVMSLLADGVPWMVMLTEVPAWMLAWAAVNRSAKSGKASRWVWSRGIWMVAVTVAGHAVWLIYGWFWGAQYDLRDAFAPICFMLVDLMILVEFTRSKFYRSLFSDFPAPQ